MVPPSPKLIVFPKGRDNHLASVYCIFARLKSEALMCLYILSKPLLV